jgi:DNA-binding IclR family transcriptional regulator
MTAQTTSRSKSKHNSSNMTQTLQRGLDVLRAFRCDAKPLSNRTIAERSDLPKATVSRITSTLVSLGYLVRLPTLGHYQLGAGMLSVGSAYLEASDIRRAALPLIEQFAARHSVSVSLAVPDHLQMIYVVWCRSPDTVSLRLTAGSALPMDRTAIGRAYLWALPAPEQRALMAQIRAAAGARTNKIVAGINSAFADLDRYGYCISIAELQKNTFGIGVPLVLDDGRTILALGAGGANLDIKEATLRRSVALNLLALAADVRNAIAESRDIDV